VAAHVVAADEAQQPRAAQGQGRAPRLARDEHARSPRDELEQVREAGRLEMMEEEVGDDHVDLRAGGIREPIEHVRGNRPERLAIHEVDLDIVDVDRSQDLAHERSVTGPDLGDGAKAAGARELGRDDARVSHERVDAHEIAPRSQRAGDRRAAARRATRPRQRACLPSTRRGAARRDS
jgi:hypothetical protein